MDLKSKSWRNTTSIKLGSTGSSLFHCEFRMGFIKQTEQPPGPQICFTAEAKQEMHKGWFSHISKAGEASILDLDKAFKALDELKEPLQESLSGFEIPYLFVIGNTSAGKSTLLRRFSQLPFFPSRKGISTRMPIRVELRKPFSDDASSAAKMSVHSYDAVARRYSDDPEDEEEISLEVAIDMVQKKMESLLERANLNQGRGVVLDKELRVRILSSNFPLVNLVDLPGIVHAKDQADSTYQLAEDTKHLFERYVEIGGRHSLFLCIVPSHFRADRLAHSSADQTETP